MQQPGRMQHSRWRALRTAGPRPGVRHRRGPAFGVGRARGREWLGIVIGVIGIAVVAGVAYFLATKAKADIERRRQEDDRVLQQEALVELEGQLVDAQAPGPAAMKQYQGAFDLLASGQGSAAEVRAAVQSAVQAHGKIQQAIAEIELPEGLPQDVARLLREAKGDLLKGYGARQTALAQAADCLDDPVPANLEAVEQALKEAKAAIASGTGKLAEAKKQMGISK